jgi:PilZ domain-containing protein
MESQKRSAYNQTRECFLGLNVIAGDFSDSSPIDWMPILANSSDACLWMVPFRGLPATGVDVLLDLVYLDGDCRVIDVVEFFPAYRIAPGRPAAASVLVLPSRTINSLQTQQGDQLVICAHAEMLWRLERFNPIGSGGAIPRAIRAPVVLRRDPTSSPDRKMLQTTGTDGAQEQAVHPQKHVMLDEANGKVPIATQSRSSKPPRNWLDRWFSPDPADKRKSPRTLSPGLFAFFWTGGPPLAHRIRDISATGMYVVSQEHWYPGTLVRITLAAAESGEQSATNSVTVLARAVRDGNDGIGLEFVQPRTLDESISGLLRGLAEGKPMDS